MPRSASKLALITGVAGQDGSWMADLLLDKGYEVFGMIRRKSSDHNEYGYAAHLAEHVGMNFIYGDVLDYENILSIVMTLQPQEVYHFAAQSHVGESFKQHSLTMQVNHGGTLSMLLACARMAEARREPVKFYNACSSEMFGTQKVGSMQNEHTPFQARSPYSVSKISQYYLGQYFQQNYRGVDVFNGIAFNHESERRPADFVSRKVTQYVAGLKIEETHVMGRDKPLLNIPMDAQLMMGNMDAYRDWGYAPDYCEAFWRMLQLDCKGDDFVIATGISRQVTDLITESFHIAGIDDWDRYVGQDSRYMRPSDVPFLCGDATKLREATGWQPETSFTEMLTRMIIHDRS